MLHHTDVNKKDGGRAKYSVVFYWKKIAVALLVSTISVAVINANVEKPVEKVVESVEESIEQTTDLSATNTLKDGTFTGEGMGNNGTIAVEVTITGGEISDIVFTKFSDDAEYFNVEKDGKEMIDQVLSKQSADVDTIAGATYSSEGFLAAVEEALEQAGQ